MRIPELDLRVGSLQQTINRTPVTIQQWQPRHHHHYNHLPFILILYTNLRVGSIQQTNNQTPVTIQQLQPRNQETNKPTPVTIQQP
jgi:hypothetical protein